MKRIAFTLTILLLVFSLTGCFGIGDRISLPSFSLGSLIANVLPSKSEEVVAETESTELQAETQPVVETTEAEPETTVAPAEAEPETQPESTAKVYNEITISSDLRYRANIFLSNFSEQGFNVDCGWDTSTQKLIYYPSSFVAEEADPMDLLKFCWLNIYFNSYSEVEYLSHESGSYHGIHIDTINYTCNRFFGTYLSRSQIPNTMNEYGFYDYLWIGDYICTPAASGGTLTDMTVTNRIYDMENGLYQIDFTIYSVNNLGDADCIVDIGGTIHDKSVYYFTAEDAASCSFLTSHLSGTAIVRPYITPKGTDSYQLVSYDLVP